ncbi:MAG: hypothetical protein RML94_12590, partial [Bacteroidia bacterium]|nr:hypothetical protein [Bacteroidia bacterium]
ACDGWALVRCEAPRPHSNPCPGAGRVGRSTVSPKHADPKRSEGTRPKNYKNLQFILLSLQKNKTYSIQFSV